MVEDKSLVVLGVKDEDELKQIEAGLTERSIPFEAFIEPHFNNAHTAVAVHPSAPSALFQPFKLL